MVKALFPIGKTQWLKWSDAQRTAFNEAREAGVPYNDAIQAANQTETPKKKGILDVIEDAVETVTDVAAVVTPVVAVAKTVAKATKGGKKK
jgi:hypothetical protein